MVLRFVIFIFFGDDDNIKNKVAANRRGPEVLEHYRVIPSRLEVRSCDSCKHGPMRVKNDPSRLLEWRFFCSRCRKQADPKKGTFVENVRLGEVSADTILLIIVGWIMGMGMRDLEEQYGISRDTGVAWYQYCRDVAAKIAWHDFEPLGGKGDIVEVDETLVFRRKYNVGRVLHRRQHWLFGGISHTTKKVFGFLVEQRSREILEAGMLASIHPQSFINSDMWPGYNGAVSIFRGHGKVNHSQAFLDPPRNRPPMRFPRGFFNVQCLDHQHVGALPPPQPPLL